MKGETQL